MRTLIRDARLVVTMDDARRRIPGGYVVVDGDTNAEVGTGDPPPSVHAGRTIDARGKVVLPGLVNTHHHLPQTLTRNVPRVQEAPLFTWLTELYEVWRGIDESAVLPIHGISRVSAYSPSRPSSASAGSACASHAVWSSACPAADAAG